MNTSTTLNGVTITPPRIRRQEEILTPEALDFLRTLHQEFEPRRRELMQRRHRVRAKIANGQDPTFLSETAHIREDSSWSVAPVAPGLEDRRVEITGPVEKKMAINALNSGAKVWLADMEDAHTPSWANVINGQLNLRDILDRTIDFTTPEGKEYKLGGETLTDLPTIVVRPRGLHLTERHLLVDGEPMAGALVDFGLHFFHNARRLIELGRGPYFYLPKTENHLEARLWEQIFTRSEEYIGLEHGTLRATVLIETITAAFEMEEILYELRDHAAGLNAGRWDYIFSIIKNFRSRGPRFILPDRSAVTMTAPFMRAYTEQLVRACHRRGAHAIGGMSAFIPSRRDHEVNARALDAVRVDKTREATDGFDGSWVAHPDLVSVALEVFDGALGENPDQRSHSREDVVPDGAALLQIAGTEGRITEHGVRLNIEVAIRYLESWLRGNGAVAIHNLMEDAATAEISRSQIWQWLHHKAITDTGEVISQEWVEHLVEEEFDRLARFDGDRYVDAREIFEASAMRDDFPTFITLPAYDRYLTDQDPARTLLPA
ncbi:malate synthase A [Galactobacter caseinivorans]|uniref:Malate synthase n=1 Tax=Galactobacter caseinivorans TaxID=2676123 RepID=A0A496PHK1_9MICC|nr:malate synthase A [Galactobacter caseinivorans]RKW69966.1 malate synthase A [Galactobacter caseinivorans]